MSDNKLFDCLNAINEKNPNYTYDKKHCSGYMLLQWFGHDKSLVNIVSQLNPYAYALDDELIYKFLYLKIPKKQRFIKWIKKNSKSEANEKDLQHLMDEYGMSRREAELSIRW